MTYLEAATATTVAATASTTSVPVSKLSKHSFASKQEQGGQQTARKANHLTLGNGISFTTSDVPSPLLLLSTPHTPHHTTKASSSSSIISKSTMKA
jgi:hypothetical protein